ncbi:MAG: GspH/FimT family pseudopilin [Thermoactinomyces sp.]
MIKRCGERGWTFVEMLLILFMLGLFTAIAMPAFSALGERAEREMFLDSLATQIQLAQLEAVSRESEVTLFLNAHEIKVNQGEEEIRTIPVPAKYNLQSNYKGNRVIFRETGQVQGGTIQIFLARQLVGKVVIQVASGRPKGELIP